MMDRFTRKGGSESKPVSQKKKDNPAPRWEAADRGNAVGKLVSQRKGACRPERTVRDPSPERFCESPFPKKPSIAYPISCYSSVILRSRKSIAYSTVFHYS